MAKLGLVPVRRGYWGNKIGKVRLGALPGKAALSCQVGLHNLPGMPWRAGSLAALLAAAAGSFLAAAQLLCRTRGIHPHSPPTLPQVHTVPTKVTGHCGSVSVRLIPAPRGKEGGVQLRFQCQGLLRCRVHSCRAVPGVGSSKQPHTASGHVNLGSLQIAYSVMCVDPPLTGAGIVAARTPKKVRFVEVGGQMPVFGNLPSYPVSVFSEARTAGGQSL